MAHVKEKLSSLYDDSFWVKVKVNGKIIYGLIDTGCTITSISSNHLKDIGYNNKDIYGEKSSSNTAGGNTIETLGKIKVEPKFGNEKYKKKMEWDVMKQKSENPQLLIGYDFFKKSSNDVLNKELSMLKKRIENKQGELIITLQNYGENDSQIKKRQFFSRRQYNLRNQEEEIRQQKIDELDIENHRLRQLLNSSLSQVDSLSNEIHHLSSHLSRNRRRYRDLEVEYESLLFQYNCARADVNRLQSYEDVQSVQNLQNNLDQIQRNFRRILEQLHQRKRDVVCILPVIELRFVVAFLAVL
ncbi:17877_t:CDS:2 [Funneliformis caledonium]|uniref:17877_t:CDS:1 n=1 Tax=Funneliformis caledonium TaxID=1117310 RepID=A0A9N9CW43_9GLOM|nr:17877_t:CDS:2 [Funneliformis caledonium]